MSTHKLLPLRRMIKVAQNAVQMEQDDYVAFIQRLTGKTTSKQLTLSEVNTVLDGFKRMGWNPVNKRDKQTRLIKFLWMRLGEEGKLEDPAISAMTRFCNGMTKGKSLGRATHAELHAIIEALKSWCKRQGVTTGNIK